MEAAHPLLEKTAIGIDVLDVPRPAGSRAARHVERLMREPGVARGSGQGGTAIGAQHHVRRQHGCQDSGELRLVASSEDEVVMNWPPKNGRHEVCKVDFVEVV